jgi:DNA-binding NtrC family response regulator
MKFVNGGELALDAMLQEPFDVVVTDMRMPGMHGDVLLREVHRLHPDTFRIVLCGYAGAQATSRLMELAQEYLMKPCAPADLVNTIERGCAVPRSNLSSLMVSLARDQEPLV